MPLAVGVERVAPARRCRWAAAPTTRPPPAPRCEPSAASAWSRSARARLAASPRSALVTTSTSGTSMIPALRNWSTSPDAGLHHHRDRVAHLLDVGLGLADARPSRPPRRRRRPPARRRPRGWRRPGRRAARRPPSSGSGCRRPWGRARSGRGRRAASRRSASRTGRRRAPPPCARPRATAATSADSSVDLPAPGGPVTPTRCAGASPPSAAGETSASSAAGGLRGRPASGPRSG